MRRFVSILCLISILKLQSNAQTTEYIPASDIYLQMEKLQVLGSVLYIAAHPDDENTRLLAWLSKDKLYRTGYLSLTRGDGGQNLIGDEQGVELGLIRTQELLAARRVDGAEQFFSRAYDFGFSKTTEEALKVWDKKKILGDIVWIIRKFQPDVIITRFPEDKRAGHGQHSASSVLAHLAFSAASDPNQYPEQFAYGVKPWQAKRIFWNNYNFGGINTTRDDQLKIEVGGYNPVIGKSYGEIAADSRSQHRSQGFGVPHTRGNSTEYFSLTEGEKADSSLMQNVDCSWSRVTGGTGISTAISQLIEKFDIRSPEKSIPALIEIYKMIKTIPPGYWRDKKMNETIALIQSCSGVFLDATVESGYARQGQTLPVSIHAVNRSMVPMTINKVSMNEQDTLWNRNLQRGTNYTLTRNISLERLPITQPYWLIDQMSSGSYNVDNQKLIGMPGNPPALEAFFEINIMDEDFVFRRPVTYKHTDAVKGEMDEPLTIVPETMVNLEPELLIFDHPSSKKIEIRKQIKTIETNDDDKNEIHPVNLPASDGQTEMSKIKLTTVPGFEISSVQMLKGVRDFMLKTNNLSNEKSMIWAVGDYGKSPDTLYQCKTISYEHIPRIDYFKPAGSALVAMNLKIKGSRIGYIEGAGDKVVEALQAMGYTVIKLKENDVSTDGINDFDAIIAGVRAFDVHDWLRKKYAILMNYIKNGGNLIVQYNRNLGNDSTGIGPYPFGISNIRVTEEEAPVTFLQPNHRIMHFPNEINDTDFKGWIQERGIYFASHIDPRYEKIFGMKDSGDNQQQEGSLIIGSYGKGNFVYTGLVFFRELPAGVPGAYRLFANLIALNQKKDK